MDISLLQKKNHLMPPTKQQSWRDQFGMSSGQNNQTSQKDTNQSKKMEKLLGQKLTSFLLLVVLVYSKNQKSIGLMKGAKWNYVNEGYRKCLSELAHMKDVIVTLFSFDDNVCQHINEETPEDALKHLDKVPFTGGRTDYSPAFEWLVNKIAESSTKHKDYLNYVLFLSDREGGYPDISVKKNH
eukprot:TRINITY_DN11894_c0_g1_i1.p1 TRINITY_DN11894_c0_g1~~TRINITY_DN11894_c0_g1_i1.p1  ORF type:complete len:184 (+),score=17.68 TRINITY_DN11894_c0_g1_i1:203-754(+)